jgi:hypothetical protein
MRDESWVGALSSLAYAKSSMQALNERALAAAIALTQQQPRCDLTIDNLPSGGTAIGTDEVPIFRPTGSGGGQVYKVLASTLSSQAAVLPTLGYVSVKDYAGVGNGVADDTVAIRAAITDATLRGVYAVFFPPGSYRTTSTITVSTQMTLFGIPGESILAPDNMFFDVIFGLGAKTVYLDGLSIKVKNATGSGGIALRWQGCQDVFVSRAQIIGCWHGSLVDSSGDVVYDRVAITPADVAGAGRYGFKCQAVAGGNANLHALSNSSVFQTGQINSKTVDAFVHARGYNSFILANCGANAVNRGLWSTNDGGAAPNFLAVQNFTTDSSHHGIVLDDGAVVQIDMVLITACDTDSFIVTSAFQSIFPGAVVQMTNFQATSTNSPMKLQANNGRFAFSGLSINPTVITPVDGIVFSNGTNARYTITGVTIDNVSSVALHFDASWVGSAVISSFVQKAAGVGVQVETAATGKYTISAGACDQNATNAFIDAASASGISNTRPGCHISGVSGLNPRGTLSLGIANSFPAAPVSTTVYTNNTGFDAVVYISSLAGVSQIAVNGQPVIGVGQVVGLVSLRIPVGATIAITHNSTPVPLWAWELE